MNLDAIQLSSRKVRTILVNQRRCHLKRPQATPFGTKASSDTPKEVLIIGGTGRIGTASATHLLCSSPPSQPLHVILAGRNRDRGQGALHEVESELGGPAEIEARGHALSFNQMDYTQDDQLLQALRGTSCVIYTAGPFSKDDPRVLRAALEAKVPCYVDVADPVQYLDTARTLTPTAEQAGTMALVSAGAFPGLSNIMAVECAARLGQPAHDINFNYFTAGLGGSGVVNLAITNFGFGEPVMNYRKGKLSPQMNAGLATQEVDFFLDSGDVSCKRVGRREVWAWPFPEALTVARELNITGDSNVKMGTAPGLWNVIMSAMVSVVPREWWQLDAFSLGLAKFSEPLVAFTDQFTGETHSIRVDVMAQDGTTVSAVHGHESFRRCVGQSAAEFALELMYRHETDVDGWKPGVYLPEELARDRQERERMLERLTQTPGTFTFKLSQGAPAPEGVPKG